jgi:hypothetical protein
LHDLSAWTPPLVEERKPDGGIGASFGDDFIGNCGGLGATGEDSQGIR